MTRRQAVLLDRLVTFCERCGSPDLPVRIGRVLGCGSFFRGKERPGDVNLIACVVGEHPLFGKFCDLVDGELRKDRTDQPPAERMGRISDSHADPAIKEARSLFVSWLGGFTDRMLFQHMFPVWTSSSVYTHPL